jgi:hypothetical protein
MKRYLKSALFYSLFFCGVLRADQQNPEVWLTVFVHGIMSIQPHLTFGNFFRFLTDSIQDTVYEKSIGEVRKNRFFYNNQLMQSIGLNPIDTEANKFDNASQVLASIYQDITRLVDPHQQNYFYTFGWSGLLSNKARYEAATQFLQELDILIAQLKSINPTLKIRLVGYSHGGNVCLNLATVKQNLYPESAWNIDELILLGCPIQSETDFLVNAPLFKRVFNIYSSKDRIQTIDFFSVNRLFSRRTISNRNTFTVDPKVAQIRVKVTRVVKSKKRSKKQLITQTLDFDQPHIRSQKSAFLRDSSPGHMELWFLGWTPRHYRKDFLLNPLPIVVFLPYLLHYIRQYAFDNDAAVYPLTIDIRPEHKALLLKQHKGLGAQYAVIPFIQNKLLQQWAKRAESIRPDPYTARQLKQMLVAGATRAKKTLQDRNIPLKNDLRLRRSRQQLP